jgi:hypothetical protein
VALESQIDAAARGDSKSAAIGDVFDRFLDTVVDASPGQWATFTVDVITHARRTRMPRRDLLEVLAMLGIADGKRTRRGFDGKAIPKRARCAGCHTMRGLMLDGRVASHKRAGEYCPGRHKPPFVEVQAVAS